MVFMLLQFRLPIHSVHSHTCQLHVVRTAKEGKAIDRMTSPRRYAWVQQTCYQLCPIFPYILERALLSPFPDDPKL